MDYLRGLYGMKTPGDAIREELQKRGWTQSDLARILDRPVPTINEIIVGKRGIMPEMAVVLGAAFGNGAQFWMRLEADYRLALVPHEVSEVQRRVRLHELAPIRDMQKRGWIRDTKEVEQIEQDLKQFFGTESLDREPQIGAATRKSDERQDLTPSQRAWCFRVKQLGHAQLVAEYKEATIPRCEQALRRIAAYPQETHKVPQTLASFGIRFVAVEPLPSSKVDGVVVWLDQSSPVIGMSLRYDRVDSFWFTLFHELMHIKHRDEAPLDGDLTDQMESVLVVKSDIERRANQEADTTLIPKAEMDSFILRVGPLYSKDRIVRFANRIKIHPGIIVGQLQRRREIGYSANREMLAKIRHFVTPAAVTDGWGTSIDPRSVT